MSWVTKTLNSTLGQKLLMALTGFFLILFLVVHLAGNLQLLIPDNGESFNLYAHNMAINNFIRSVSIINFGLILLHVVYSVILTKHNKKARPVGYAETDASTNSTWASRNMGILGTLILIFLLVHLRGFWYRLKFGSPDKVLLGDTEVDNAFIIVVEAFKNPIYVGFYVISMVFLAFHLSHGFASAFQTLGINHKKYTPLIQKVGLGFAILIPTLFAMIPIVMYIQSL
ncbi:succinate dehydrogenase cytochrome b subunit [Pleomorphovibrio marinus]|uniref:succinate dehydrogenase cytochrome b subunit n=1 Tax=Pleomorphovibrio marinus TaxID=2164132 RepID=UPI000E0A2A32|nr:succinate dehydrogenase cytochrome b subunit [Pleomorphovibrio marinus]